MQNKDYFLKKKKRSLVEIGQKIINYRDGGILGK